MRHAITDVLPTATTLAASIGYGLVSSLIPVVKVGKTALAVRFVRFSAITWAANGWVASWQ